MTEDTPQEETLNEVAETPPAAEAVEPEETPEKLSAASSESAVEADAANEKTGDKKESPISVAPPVQETEKSATEESATVTANGKQRGNRAEKIGIVSSDKMQKTVVVRVDRLVKHPIYRRYVRKTKKFMAHDEIGAKIGDKVKIMETRPLSARKRWRVIEIVQKAVK